MKIKSMRPLYMIVIGFGAVLMVFNAILSFRWEVLRITTPECQEHVKVVDKRIADAYVYDTSGYYSLKHFYLATFEFPDGAKKEFQIGGSRKTIYIGDTGMLTYHESKFIEDIYRKETDRWRGRLIISFEKDPEFGGTKIIRYKLSYSVKSFLIGAGVIVLLTSVILICLKLM